MRLDNLQQEQITYWLRLWHGWSRASDRVCAGYARTSLGFESYRASRQYDDANGALDHDADMAEAREVDRVISRLQDPWRTALHFEARNIDLPAKLWVSARIMQEEIERVTQEARQMLWDGMERAGLGK